MPILTIAGLEKRRSEQTTAQSIIRLASHSSFPQTENTKALINKGNPEMSNPCETKAKLPSCFEHTPIFSWFYNVCGLRPLCTPLVINLKPHTHISLSPLYKPELSLYQNLPKLTLYIYIYMRTLSLTLYIVIFLYVYSQIRPLHSS